MKKGRILGKSDKKSERDERETICILCYSECEKSGKDNNKRTKENWASDRTLKQMANGGVEGGAKRYCSLRRGY